jgi:hypothetical protein
MTTNLNDNTIDTLFDIIKELRTCDTCGRPRTPDRICTLPGPYLDVCLGTPARPFWRQRDRGPHE